MPLKLEGRNLKNFLKEIPSFKLCQTFRDAIVVTQHLGLEYLWIDSLCIIQDDPEDWRRESIKMSGVYGSAAINIAATSASDGTIGCFSTRPWKLRLPVRLHEQKTVCDFSLKLPYKNLDNEPLRCRAWAFQERFLAPRTLHFTNSQVFWECNGIAACETFPELVQVSDPVILTQLIEYQTLFDFWKEAVNLYSRGKLTYAKDKLIAICGVAKWFQDRMKDDYFAGIWRRNLEKQLCWRTDKNFWGYDIYSDTRSTEYLAPSWSWASVESHAQFRSLRWEPAWDEGARTQIQVLSISAIPENEDNPLGPVKGGKLRLVVSKLAHGIEITNRDSKEFGYVLSPNNTTILADNHVHWDFPKEARGTLYLLPILHLPEHTPPHRTFEEGIILEVTDHSKRGEYRRVGYYFFELKVPHEECSELVYEEVIKNGEKLYAITIV
jgi:Heterokaryon incompatibility protein (HET)